LSGRLRASAASASNSPKIGRALLYVYSKMKRARQLSRTILQRDAELFVVLPKVLQ
jgi:hypothetical protein